MGCGVFHSHWPSVLWPADQVRLIGSQRMTRQRPQSRQGTKKTPRARETAQAIKRQKIKKMRGKRREASWRKMTRRRPQSRQGTKKTPRARETVQAIKRKKIQKGRKRREASWRKMTRRRPQSRQGTK